MKLINGFPRRFMVKQYTPEEMAIEDAISAVEGSGCHPLLTDALSLLVEAQNKVADFVELRDDLIK